MKKFLALALSALALSTAALAEEHLPGTIAGTDIALYEHDHAFAGKILDLPVMGIFDEAGFTAHMTVRRGTETIAFDLVDDGATYSGTVSEVRIDAKTGAKTTVATPIEFMKAAKTGPATGELLLKIDGVETKVSISGKSFVSGHFEAPSYSATIRGKPVDFAFTGWACFGYSANLTMMIYGAYAHLSK